MFLNFQVKFSLTELKLNYKNTNREVMMKRKILVIFLIFGIFMISFAKEINIGVIYGDMSEETRDYLNTNLKRELEKNFENTQFDPVIKKETTAGAKQLEEAIDKYQKDSSIEVVFSLNMNPYESLKVEKKFNKLVIAPFFYGVYVDGEVKNLNAIATDYNLKEVAGILNDIKPLEKIGVIFSPDFAVTAESYIKRLVSEQLFTGDNIIAIPLNQPEEIIKGDIFKIDALLVLSNNNGFLKARMEEAAKLGIPTFSFFSDADNDSGVLMGYSFKDEIERRIRVAAVNLLKYYEGRDFSELSTRLDSANLDIFVNYEVAEEADIYPWNFLSEKIKMVNEPSFGNTPLTINSALKQLFEQNTELKSKNKELISSKYDVDISKSGIKPDLTANLDYEKLDDTRAGSDPTNAENTVRGGVKLTQVLYDEDTFSNVTIQKKLYDAAKEEFRQEEITQIQNLIVTYLSVLKSHANFEIEKYNSTLLKKYLSVAKMKQNIGSSGPEDVYRFESELADSTTNLEDIRSDIFSGNSDLNRLLNLSMDNYFSLSEDGIGDIIDLPIFEGFENELNKPWKFDKLKSYFIRAGIDKAPEIKRLDAQIAAKERQLKAAKRKRYIPKLTADASYEKDVTDPWGEGSQNVDSDEYWSVGVGFTFPLYSGGELKYTQKQIETELDQLKIDRETQISKISQSISSQYGQVFTNLRKIKSSEKSVEASRKNLLLQSDLYMKGKITATDMIDARNSLINAEQTNTSVKYDFFISLAELERLCGKYYFEYTGLEKDEINNLIKSLIASKQEER